MPVRNLTDDEVLSLLKSYDWTHGSKAKKVNALVDYTISLLMLDAGLRVGEVHSLKISDLVYNSRPRTSLIIMSEKKKKSEPRTIPVSPRLSTAINLCWLSFWCTYINREHAWSFSMEESDGRLSIRNIEWRIRVHALKVLGRPIHPHMLRHTFGTALMKITDIRTVQELLGHKYLSSTQVYTHPDENDKRNAIVTISAGSCQKQS